MGKQAVVREYDASAELRERVLAAYRQGMPLNIVGGGSKAFYGRKSGGEPLSIRKHHGIVSYEPSELVLTARAGTPLVLIEKVLAERGQMLAFEPPHFGPAASLGGAVATGLSGPRRPYAGAARDFVLGVKLLNGQGEILRFGGEVMKNVAGFDVSRLMVGALGTLGVLLEISLKVLPRPESETSLIFEMDEKQSLTMMNRWAGQIWPVSAACHDGQRLCLRLSGAEGAIASARQKLGGEDIAEGERFWSDLREQRLAFFGQTGSLWRLSLAPATPSLDLPGSSIMDWGGALRWLKTEASAETIFAAASVIGAHATLFRPQTPANRVFQPLSDRLKQLHLKLKRAFDPRGILNPGRMYEEW